MIIHTTDRRLALKIGRMLSAQRFFHDVSYETQLVDSSIYLYEFTNRTLYTQHNQHTQTSGSDCWSESESASGMTNNDRPYNLEYNNIPNGIVTDLTHCYVPTCWDVKPCYSPICPKRMPQVRDAHLNSLFVSSLTCYF